MQKEINELIAYADQKEMKINESKTKVMIFNTRKNFDTMPEVYIHENSMLDVIDEVKLLGIQIRSDLKWFSNTNQICDKAYKRLWIMRRLKSLGADTLELLDVYKKQVLSVLELAVPVWSPGLTRHEIMQLERVQKAAVHIILGDKHIDYTVSAMNLKLHTLEKRRVEICQKVSCRTQRYEKSPLPYLTNLLNQCE